MTGESSESVRAANIIWNSAGDYTFISEVKAYDERGRADLYFNYIIGAVHRYWDYGELSEYFDTLDARVQREVLTDLLWLGLENCAYLRGSAERPVLASLRAKYAESFLRRRALESLDAAALEADSAFYTLDSVRVGHFSRIIGREEKLPELSRKIMSLLEFPADIDVAGMRARMDELINNYFSQGALSFDRRWKKRKKDIFFLKFNGNQYADASMGLEFDDELRQKNDAFSKLMRLQGMSPEKRRERIIGCYGDPAMAQEEVARREKRLCVGVHSGCRLYFTRGEHAEAAQRFSEIARHREEAERQRRLNTLYYRDNSARYATAIAKLTNEIKNALLINLDTPAARSVCGELDTGKVWRSAALSDERVFLRKLKNDNEDIGVDIMLDSSASQSAVQEIVAAQAYVIAEAFTRCRIPVRIYSFCSDNEYTVIRVFREYNEPGGNKAVFGYHASGCNRDGLAIKTAVDMIASAPHQKKILIVLSDGLPNDTQGMITGGVICDYLGAMGIDDAALEVRRGMQRGVNVLCCFTGREIHIADAKRIYGRDMAYLAAKDRFADIVGVLMRKQICDM